MRLQDIMSEMNDNWNRAETRTGYTYFKPYKAYKTRQKRAITEIINTMDEVLTDHSELTEKDKAIFREFSQTVVTAFKGRIMDSMQPRTVTQ